MELLVSFPKAKMKQSVLGKINYRPQELLTMAVKNDNIRSVQFIAFTFE
jgi:hypothetical protein